MVSSYHNVDCWLWGRGASHLSWESGGYDCLSLGRICDIIVGGGAQQCDGSPSGVEICSALDRSTSEG